MLTPALSLPCVMFWLLLLIPASLSAQTGTWDEHTCTKGVVSVSRGERAVMACNVSNPILHITISLVRSGEASQPIFNNVSPGNHVNGTWKLWIQEGMAQLVTEKAQDSQAGQYKWRITARQTKIENTTLNISEPQEPPFVPSQGPEKPFTLPRVMSQSQRKDPSIVPVLVILFVILLVILGFIAAFWHRRHSFARLQELPQESQI